MGLLGFYTLKFENLNFIPWSLLLLAKVAPPKWEKKNYTFDASMSLNDYVDESSNRGAALLMELNFKVWNSNFQIFRCKIQITLNFKGVLCNLPYFFFRYNCNFTLHFPNKIR